MALHRLLKRKGCVDEVNDDFPLSSPATKIRRLVSVCSLNYSPSVTNLTSFLTNRFRLHCLRMPTCRQLWKKMNRYPHRHRLRLLTMRELSCFSNLSLIRLPLSHSQSILTLSKELRTVSVFFR